MYTILRQSVQCACASLIYCGCLDGGDFFVLCFKYFFVIYSNSCSKLEEFSPFERKIQKEEHWLYSNPRTNSYVPSWVLWPIVFTAPLTVFVIYFLISRNKLEFSQANLAATLAIALNGLLTNTLKLTVGKLIWKHFCDFAGFLIYCFVVR